MNSNAFFLRSFRVLLIPIALLYGIVIIIRNWLYTKEIISSIEFNLPVICVGNLTFGGTGKSPMIETILSFTNQHYKMATLSRGYKRKTKGFVIVDDTITSLEIGDEPMQFYLKFPQVTIAVAENRIIGIPLLLQDKNNIDAILLDDALQHRKIKAGYNILLTDYSNPFYHDYFLPTGDLRDQKSSYKRSHIIVVTKCPLQLSIKEKENILYHIQPQLWQKVFFTSIQYGAPYHLFDTKKEITLHIDTEILLVCGIANPKPLKDYLQKTVHSYSQLLFADHHIFTIDEINHIQEQLHKINSTHKIILTTEKDAVRLTKFKSILQDVPIYVIPIQHHFLFNTYDEFKKIILHFIQSFHSS